MSLSIVSLQLPGLSKKGETGGEIMSMREGSLGVSISLLDVVGSVGFINLSEHARFQAFQTVDVLQLLATGMCYGVALAGILSLIRGKTAE